MYGKDIFVWNFKGTLWNSAQNILPIHWKIWFLYNIEILKVLRFKSSCTFSKRPPVPLWNCSQVNATEPHQWEVNIHSGNGLLSSGNVNQGLWCHMASLGHSELKVQWQCKDKEIWIRSRRCGCLVTWFCYQLIAKPGNKTTAPSWPDPYSAIFVTWHFMNWPWMYR